ncbi:bulb-type lectin domain-containing protein [Artemisia annua]|uniref:Bulb-type lectin domain-containing protein n=1 Tax=Artemisia annua TaxID=35608 RepID=A0A2U1L9K1_ARTAN|nr:bulb-type lectin domain-containing protein [Artemisia annua]
MYTYYEQEKLYGSCSEDDDQNGDWDVYYSYYHFTLSQLFVSFAVCLLLLGTSGRRITVVNNCGFTVWPGISSSPVLNITGFELTEGESRSFQAPTNWTGHIWGRTSCRLNGSGHWSCATGDCGTGEMECYGKTYTPPVTITEIDIRIYEASYDVSIMNGFNLPMTVEPTDGHLGYPKVGCVNDLNLKCPRDLQLEVGGGCKSACQVFPSQDYCCNYTDEYDESDSTVASYGGGDYTVRFCDTFSSIKLGGQLTYGDQLVSLGGNFTLGFFSADSSYFTYLGIWYTNDNESRKVWVANAEYAYGDHALSIDPNTGNLIITDRSRTLITITNIDAGPNPNVTATLEDNGNFRLINENDKRVLWQNFDHPTNVLLPGMKLGYDITTGQNWTLTSWLSNEIPDAGAFTLSWEPVNETSHKILIRRRGQPYWTSENLDNQTFHNIFTIYGYTLTSVYNNKERYISYDISQDSGNGIGRSSFPMWILTPDGQIDGGDNDSQWVPKFCNEFQSHMGCVESSLPLCRRENEEFSYRNGDFAPHKTSNADDSNSSLSISDCFVKCWNDCSCVGFNSRTNGIGCIFWRGRNSFSDDPRESSLWMYVIGPQNPTAEEEKQKREEYFLELTASDSFKDVHHLESNGGKGTDLLLFSFASIVAATNDFSVENKLGQGGFGPVFKAWELWQQGNATELVDMTLRNTCVVQQFVRTVHVALLCVQEKAADRPTTSDMITMLLNDTIPLPAPNKPAFFINRFESTSTTPEERNRNHYTANNLTITAMEGR